MNLVALVGNVATDPELRHTDKGNPICTFRLAVPRANGKEADFFTIVTWARQAEVCGQHVSIGRRIAVNGRLHHSVWTADDGSRRSRVEVIAQRVELLGPGRRSEGPAQQEHEAEQVAAAEPVPTPEFALG